MVAATLLAIISLAVPRAPGDTVLSRIERMISHSAVVCGDFEQSKTLVGLRLPVRSSGRFCVTNERGVLWDTQAPFPSTVVLTRDEVVESQGGKVTSRVTTSTEPGIPIISGLLFSVLGGDLEQLRTQFDIDAVVEAATWRARLTPKDAGMRRVIGSIQLTGGGFVRQVTIAEASGDRTVITFTDIATGNSALRPADVRAFALSAGGQQPRR